MAPTGCTLFCIDMKSVPSVPGYKDLLALCVAYGAVDRRGRGAGVGPLGRALTRKEHST